MRPDPCGWRYSTRTSTGTSRAAPDRPDRLFLDGAQQLDLQGERQVGDLVEEQGAAFRGLKQPCLVACAPVKLPFTCPNSSLSIRSCGIAPQFTGTNGRSARGPRAWISRAASSLPVPDSPLMWTGAWLRASLAMGARTCAMAGESPSSSGRPAGAAGRVEQRGVPQPQGAVDQPAQDARSTGLETKSNAPAFRAAMADSMLPWAVMTATGRSG